MKKVTVPEALEALTTGRSVYTEPVKDVGLSWHVIDGILHRRYHYNDLARSIYKTPEDWAKPRQKGNRTYYLEVGA